MDSALKTIRNIEKQDPDHYWVLRKLRPSKTIFCPILSTEFKVKFNSKFRGLSFRNFENKGLS